jgi:hypothetical protein
VTTGTGDSVAANDADTLASDWKALRADGDIQFAPLKPPERSEPPDWLENLFRFLGEALGPLAYPLMWVAIAVGAGLLALVLWQILAPLVRGPRAGKAGGETTPEWAPDAGEALTLLEDADRLAADGRYDEATHLLLKRSVGQIAAARPGLLEPSSTAREIAELPALSDAARGAFALIAGRVERSLFALRSLTVDDWHAARAAYADFALAARHNALALA